MAISSKERRELIIKRLIESDKPIKGQELAEEFGVTRQVIVKDIAILRAQNSNIIATLDGYTIENESSGLVKIIAVMHTSEDTRDELMTIIKYGGIVKDIIIEHGVYGEIRALLEIKSIHDIDKFIERLEDTKSKVLSSITDGVHIHTIEVENEEVYEKILDELREKGYLLAEQ